MKRKKVMTHTYLIRVDMEVKEMLDFYKANRSYNHLLKVLIKDYEMLNGLKKHLHDCVTYKNNVKYDPFEFIDYGYERQTK